MAGVDKLALAARRPPAARPHAGGARRGAGRRAHRRRDRAGAPGRPGRRLRGCPPLVDAVVAGGATRHDSVAAGFQALEALVPDRTGERSCSSTTAPGRSLPPDSPHGSSPPPTRTARPSRSLPVAETVKRVDGDRVVATVDRATLAARPDAPGRPPRHCLRAALADPRAADGPWTDEAALLEACRIPVHVVPGDPSNLKVTVPADLARAASLVAPGATRRHGIGHDSHPFGPGGPLRLGGMTFDGCAAPRRPLRRRRRAARDRRRAARRGRTGRPRPPVPGRSGDAGRDRQRRRCSTRSSSGWRPPAGDRPRST